MLTKLSMAAVGAIAGALTFFFVVLNGDLSRAALLFMDDDGREKVAAGALESGAVLEAGRIVISTMRSVQEDNDYTFSVNVPENGSLPYSVLADAGYLDPSPTLREYSFTTQQGEVVALEVAGENIDCFLEEGFLKNMDDSYRVVDCQKNGYVLTKMTKK